MEKSYTQATDFVEKFMAYKAALYNFEAAKQQGESMAEYAEELAKCMEVARRISNGDKVPPSDEQRLLRYNYKIYMAARNMAAMKAYSAKKEYDSLWKNTKDEEEEKSAAEIVNDMQAPIEMPDSVSLENAAPKPVSPQGE